MPESKYPIGGAGKLCGLSAYKETKYRIKRGTGYLRQMDISCAFFNVKGRVRDETILYSGISNRRPSGQTV